MRAHVIDNGAVVNTIEVETLDVLPGLVAAEGNEGIGWLYDGHAFTAPAPDLTAQRAAHWESIKAERDKRIQTGGYQASGKWFHSDTFSRTQQMGLVMMGAGIPANLQWKTMDGSFVTMTQTLAGQVFAAAAASDAAVFARAEQIKATMDADPAAFDLAAHAWPAVFGE
jgi:hypothetical protein